MGSYSEVLNGDLLSMSQVQVILREAHLFGIKLASEENVILLAVRYVSQLMQQACIFSQLNNSSPAETR